MTLLLNLYLGHLLGDFVLQPGWLVVAKRRGVSRPSHPHRDHRRVHRSYPLRRTSHRSGTSCLLAMAAHLGIEVITIRMRGLERLSGLSVFLIDQAMHIISLVILVWVATPIAPVNEIKSFGLTVDPAVVALACGLIMVTFMGSIIVFEILNSVGPDSWDRDILPWNRARILGMLERGTSLVLGVLINPDADDRPVRPPNHLGSTATARRACAPDADSRNGPDRVRCWMGLRHLHVVLSPTQVR